MAMMWRSQDSIPTRHVTEMQMRKNKRKVLEPEGQERCGTAQVGPEETLERAVKSQRGQRF